MERNLRIVCHDDAEVSGAVLIDWDIESGQSWVHGPWIAVDDDRWHEIGSGLVDAAMSQLPPGITKSVMTASVGHHCMAAIAHQLGWSAGEVNHVLRVDAPTVAAWSFLSPPAPGGLRTMTDEDVAAVRSLHDVEFPGTYYSASELAARVTRGDQIVLIADRRQGRHNDGDEIDGYIAGQIQPDGDGYIDFLAVAHSARRAGLGRRLVVGLCRQLMAESTTQRVCLTVQTTRSPARALYESLGFEQEIAIIGFEAPPGEPAREKPRDWAGGGSVPCRRRSRTPNHDHPAYPRPITDHLRTATMPCPVTLTVAPRTRRIVPDMSAPISRGHPHIMRTVAPAGR